MGEWFARQVEDLRAHRETGAADRLGGQLGAFAHPEHGDGQPFNPTVETYMRFLESLSAVFPHRLPVPGLPVFYGTVEGNRSEVTLVLTMRWLLSYHAWACDPVIVPTLWLRPSVTEDEETVYGRPLCDVGRLALLLVSRASQQVAVWSPRRGQTQSRVLQRVLQMHGIPLDVVVGPGDQLVEDVNACFRLEEQRGAGSLDTMCTLASTLVLHATLSVRGDCPFTNVSLVAAELARTWNASPAGERAALALRAQRMVRRLLRPDFQPDRTARSFGDPRALRCSEGDGCPHYGDPFCAVHAPTRGPAAPLGGAPPSNALREAVRPSPAHAAGLGQQDLQDYLREGLRLFDEPGPGPPASSARVRHHYDALLVRLTRLFSHRLLHSHVRRVHMAARAWSRYAPVHLVHDLGCLHDWGEPVLVPVVWMNGNDDRWAHMVVLQVFPRAKLLAVWDGAGGYADPCILQGVLRREPSATYTVVLGPVEEHPAELQNVFERTIADYNGRSTAPDWPHHHGVEGGVCAAVSFLVLLCALRFGSRDLGRVSDLLVEIMGSIADPRRRHGFVLQTVRLLERLLDCDDDPANLARLLGYHRGSTPRRCAMLDPRTGVACGALGSPLCEAHRHRVLWMPY